MCEPCITMETAARVINNDTGFHHMPVRHILPLPSESKGN